MQTNKDGRETNKSEEITVNVDIIAMMQRPVSGTQPVLPKQQVLIIVFPQF